MQVKRDAKEARKQRGGKDEQTKRRERRAEKGEETERRERRVNREKGKRRINLERRGDLSRVVDKD